MVRSRATANRRSSREGPVSLSIVILTHDRKRMLQDCVRSLLDQTYPQEKIEIIDKTGKNSITLDAASNTITITSEQDIHIEAAKGTIKLSAKNIELASSAETKVTAKGGLTLSWPRQCGMASSRATAPAARACTLSQP